MKEVTAFHTMEMYSCGELIFATNEFLCIFHGEGSASQRDINLVQALQKDNAIAPHCHILMS